MSFFLLSFRRRNFPVFPAHLFYYTQYGTNTQGLCCEAVTGTGLTSNSERVRAVFCSIFQILKHLQRRQRISVEIEERRLHWPPQSHPGSCLPIPVPSRDTHPQGAPRLISCCPSHRRLPAYNNRTSRQLSPLFRMPPPLPRQLCFPGSAQKSE